MDVGPTCTVFVRQVLGEVHDFEEECFVQIFLNRGKSYVTTTTEEPQIEVERQTATCSCAEFVKLRVARSVITSSIKMTTWRWSFHHLSNLL